MTTYISYSNIPKSFVLKTSRNERISVATIYAATRENDKGDHYDWVPYVVLKKGDSSLKDFEDFVALFEKRYYGIEKVDSRHEQVIYSNKQNFSTHILFSRELGGRVDVDGYLCTTSEFIDIKEDDVQPVLDRQVAFYHVNLAASIIENKYPDIAERLIRTFSKVYDDELKTRDPEFTSSDILED